MSCAIFCKSHSSANFIFFVWILNISNLPVSSGTPISNSLSNLPKRLKAVSKLLGLFVAPITITCPLAFKPSINVNNWDTIRLSTSPWTLSLFGAIESISSINIIAGEFFSASSNALRKLPSASPAILLIISGPLIKKKKAPVSFAIALANKVFPLPGGPYNKTPLGGLIPKFLNNWGCLKGSSIISLIAANCFLHPPISSYPTPSALSSSSRLIGSPSSKITVWGPTIQHLSGSVSTTLNSTDLNPPLHKNVSPLWTGRYASLKYGIK